MKRVGHLFEKLVSDENLSLAIDEVNRTHRYFTNGRVNHCTRWVSRTREDRIRDLKEVLIGGFEPGPSRFMIRYDHSAEKHRCILEPKQWPDQYVHHALIQVIEPVCMRGMDPWCCGSIRGRGTHYAKRAIERWIREDPIGTRYVGEMDIRHFYDELSPDIVMDRFRHLIKDRRVLDLIWRIIRDGVKIGYYPSQWFANTVLQPLDVMIRQSGLVKHYVRYMDNMTVMGSNKRKTRRVKLLIENWLNSHGLRLKGNWQFYARRDRLPNAVGYRYGADYTLIRKRSLLKIKRGIAKYRKFASSGKPITRRFAAGMLSRLGQLHHCNNVHIYRKLFMGDPIQRELKDVVRASSITHRHRSWK